MKRVTCLFCLLICTLFATKSFGHPGSGIVIDKYGNVYFTDTGKGVWKIDTKGNLSYIPASRFHWMTIDTAGYFATAPKSFGNYFERVTDERAKPALIMCSDFPLVINNDGNIYYADTRRSSTRIVQRSLLGKETVVAKDKIFEFVSGITSGEDGSLYITEGSNPNSNTIRKITRDGKVSIVSTFVGKTGTDLPFETTPSYCRGLTLDSAGNIYVAVTGSRSLIKINPQNKVETILQDQGPWTPTGVAVFKGEVYVLEWHDVEPSQSEVREAYIPRVRKIALDGKVTTLVTVSRK